MKFYRRWHNVRAMTFDLDDTFYDNHPYIRLAEQRMFEHLNRECPEVRDLPKARWKQARRQVLQTQPELANDMILLRQQVLQLVLTACGYQGEDLRKAWQSAYDIFYFERSNFQVDEKIIAVLEQLAQRYPLVAITNGNVDLKRIGIAPYFDLALHASAQQPMKPHPSMFQKAAAHLKLPPQAILHVGDNLEKDVLGAINAGFRGAWYAHNRPMSLASEPATVLPDIELQSLEELLLL